MCGLPASGKTHWVQEYVKSNAEKKITVIGNTHLLEKMTVRELFCMICTFFLRFVCLGVWNAAEGPLHRPLECNDGQTAEMFVEINGISLVKTSQLHN